MYTLFVAFIVLAAVAMIFIVLIQESKGGGLASSFASYNQIGGVRKTTDIVEKTTWGLAIFMVVFSIFSTWVAPKAESHNSVIEGIELPSNDIPGFGASQTQEESTIAPIAPAETPAQPAK